MKPQPRTSCGVIAVIAITLWAVIILVVWSAL